MTRIYLTDGELAVARLADGDRHARDIYPVREDFEITPTGDLVCGTDRILAGSVR